MNTIYLKSIIFFALLFSPVIAQKIASFDVAASHAGNRAYNIVNVDLDKITFLSEDELALFAIDGDIKTSIPIQILNVERRILYWIAGPSSVNRIYELHRVTDKEKRDIVKIRKENGLLILSQGKKDLLGYQFETMYPPSGIDSAYKRSAFIHPLWSPKGQILTRVQPEDHYHHYGIWNPWTHVLFEKDTVDFWNIKGRQGTVRHNKFVSLRQGSVFGEFQALHDHVAFRKDGSEKVAINELQTVRVYNLQDETYIVDLTINLNCASDNPVKLLEYRYGGFGWRATKEWNPQNSEMRTSEGKSRVEADNARGDWFYLQGEIKDEYAGILMMSHPANFDHPQPMRMWSDPDENRGFFASFSPTRDKDWLLEPGETYTLRYRFVVYNGRFNTQISEQFWQNYSNPPKVTVNLSE